MSQPNIAAKKQTSNATYYLWMAIGLFFIFLFGKVVPPFAGIDSIGVSMIGIFIGCLLMVSVANQPFWPLLLGFVGMIACGFSSQSDLLASWFGNVTIQQLIWLFAVTGAVADSGAVQVLAYKLLSLKICKGHPKLFLFIIFVGFTVVSMLLQASTALVILFLTIADSICEACKIDRDSELKRVICLGVYVSTMGVYILPFKIVGALALANSAFEAQGLAFNTATYITVSACMVLAIVLIYWLLTCFVWKPDLTPLKNFDFEAMNVAPEQMKLNRRQKIMLGTLLVGIVYLFISTFAPKGGAVHAFTSTLGTVWIWVVLLAFLCMIRVDGQPLVNGAKVLQSKVMWGILAMAGCFSILGNCIASDEHGIKTAIAAAINGTIGQPNWIFLVFFCIALTTIATNLTSGFAVSYPLLAICLPMAITMEAAGGINATALATGIIVSSFFAYMTPGAVVYAPILLDHPGITKKFIWTKGAAVVGIFILVATAFCALLGYAL